jgi:anti-anti-sigma factor
MNRTPEETQAMPESTVEGPPPVLLMVGDIDIATEQEWRRRGAELLEANPEMRDVLVDMARVAFLDSRGMAVLVDLHAGALSRGGKLTLRSVPPRVQKALGVAGLDQIFQIDGA